MAKRHLTPDDEMSRLLEHRLQHVPATSAEVCADAETLASYVDDGMSAAERAEWEAHFATCAKCRRSLALMARLKETASPEWEGEAARDNPSSGGNLWVWMPLAACILLAAGLWFATRPAERTFGASNAAGDVSATGAVPVTQQAREESPRAAAPTPPPARVAEPAASAVPQRQLADRKDDALRERRPSEAVVAKARREAAASESETGRLSGELKSTAPAPAPPPPPAAPAAPGAASQFAVGRDFQLAQKTQMRSGPREQQQQQAVGAIGGKTDNLDAAAANTNAVNARPSGPTNVANVNAPAPAAAQKPAAPKQQEKQDKEKKNEAAPTPTFHSGVPVVAGAAAGSGAAASGSSAAAGAAPAAAPPATTPATPPAVAEAVAVESRTGAQPQAESSTRTQDHVMKRVMNGNERDANLAAQRAAGLLAVVADPARPARQWRVFKFGRIEVTRDNGGSWNNDVLRLDTTFAATSTPAPGVCWIVGSKGTVWHLGLGVTPTPASGSSVGDADREKASANAGANDKDTAQSQDKTSSMWQERRVPTDEDLVSVTATSAQDAVVVARSGQRFVTSDGGKTWKRQ